MYSEEIELRVELIEAKLERREARERALESMHLTARVLEEFAEYAMNPSPTVFDRLEATKTLDGFRAELLRLADEHKEGIR